MSGCPEKAVIWTGIKPAPKQLPHRSTRYPPGRTSRHGRVQGATSARSRSFGLSRVVPSFRCTLTLPGDFLRLVNPSNNKAGISSNE